MGGAEPIACRANPEGFIKLAEVSTTSKLAHDVSDSVE